MGDRKLDERLSASATRMGQYCGTSAVATCGNTAAELAALRTSCGLISLTWRSRFLLTGPDRVRWCNGIVTNNIRDLAPGQGVYCFFLSPQGRILADLYCYNRGDDLLIETDAAQAPGLRTAWDRYIIMDEVEIQDAPPATKLGLVGPRAAEVLRIAVAAPGEGFAGLAPLATRAATWQGATVTIIHDDNEAASGFEIWLPTAGAAEFWQALTVASAIPVGFEALELLRIWSHRPLYGVDISERYLPQETAQQRALNFNKGCYVGQEIVERIHSRGLVHRVFAALAVDGDAPEPGTKISSGDKEVGEVTSAARIPAVGAEPARTIALGYVRREALAGEDLRIGEARASVVRSPAQELAGARK